MYIIDITQPFTLFLIIAAVVLLIFLSKEVKKSYIAAIPLFAFLGLLIIHVIQWLSPELLAEQLNTVRWCIVIDFVFIFITFFAYLWTDDVETKFFNKKSIDNSLDWFWKEI